MYSHLSAMSQDSKRRLCKFTTTWCLFKEFSSWLVPVKYQNQKAYCILCKRVFSVSHSGLHDVKAHWKGKKHLQLQEQEMEKCADENMDPPEIKAYTLTFNEELNSLEEDTRLDDFSNNQDFYTGREQYNTSNHSYGGDSEHDDSKHPMNDDIIVENILTPTVTIDSDPESSPPITMIPDRDVSLQIKSQMSAQQYCLRWKYHHSNLQIMFIQLLQRESFCDVTLACEGKMLRAHKVVLSACSTYFDKIFSEHEEKDPVVILKDVKFVDIKALVEFMYKGEINVENSHLTSLLKTAEDLKIKGLADVGGKSIPKEDEEDDINQKVTVTSKENQSLINELNSKRDDDVGDYDDMFTPAIVDGSTSNHYESDDDDVRALTPAPSADMKGKFENKPEFVTPGNEQSFSTLIAQLSETGNHQEYRNEEYVNDRHHENDANPEMATLANQFPDVIKMNDYLTTGRRQQFWEEPFTRRLMEAIKNKEIEMKAAAELMGVSYGTLYGRYRDAYGCLKHPYRTKDFWAEQGPADILTKLQKKEITLFRAAEMLNVTVTTLANYLSTLRYEKHDEEKDSENEDDEEEMDINESIDTFLADPVSMELKTEAEEDNINEDEDSRSSSNAVDRSEEEYI